MNVLRTKGVSIAGELLPSDEGLRVEVLLLLLLRASPAFMGVLKRCNLSASF
jgi:hypothetical protein